MRRCVTFEQSFVYINSGSITISVSQGYNYELKREEETMEYKILFKTTSAKKN